MRNAHLHLKLVAHTLRGATAALPILLLSGRQTLFVSRPTRSAHPLPCPCSHRIWAGALHLVADAGTAASASAAVAALPSAAVDAILV